METAIEAAPVLELNPADVAGMVTHLAAYHQIYSPLFQRREQRENAELYLRGLLSPLERKSVEPMVLELMGVDRNAIRSLQYFVSDGTWDDAAILQRHWAEVERTMGEADGVVMVDGSDFPKQGKESVGVKRQYCGELGKRANCQAGVFAGYLSSAGYTLLDRRLYLPAEWLTEAAFAERRAKCGVLPDQTFATKPELALAMIEAVVASGALRCRWVTADEAFGRDTAFLDGVAQTGLWYFAEVPHDTCVWLVRPATQVPTWNGRGRRPTRSRLVAETPPTQTVAQVAAQVAAQDWQLAIIKEGSQGPLVAEFAARRVVAVRAALPGPDVWLVLRRHPVTGELKTYLANAPSHTPLPTLVRMSGCRWPIETCFEDSKQLFGMGDYEIRSWTGWHHHMTLVILAHFFVVRTKLALKKKRPP